MLTKKNNLWNPGYRILDCSRSRRPLATGWRHITSLNKRLKVLTILSQGSDFSLEFVVFLFREFTVILGTGWFRKKAKPSIPSRSQIIPLFLNSWKRIWWSRFIPMGSNYATALFCFLFFFFFYFTEWPRQNHRNQRQAELKNIYSV